MKRSECPDVVPVASIMIVQDGENAMTDDHGSWRRTTIQQLMMIKQWNMLRDARPLN